MENYRPNSVYGQGEDLDQAQSLFQFSSEPDINYQLLLVQGSHSHPDSSSSYIATPYATASDLSSSHNNRNALYSTDTSLNTVDIPPQRSGLSLGQARDTSHPLQEHGSNSYLASTAPTSVSPNIGLEQAFFPALENVRPPNPQAVDRNRASITAQAEERLASTTDRTQAAAASTSGDIWLISAMCGIWRRTHPMQPTNYERDRLQRFFNVSNEECSPVWKQMYSENSPGMDQAPPSRYQKLHVELLFSLWTMTTWAQREPTREQIESATELFSMSKEAVLRRLPRYSEDEIQQRRDRAKEKYGSNQFHCTANRGSGPIRLPSDLVRDPLKPLVCTTCFAAFPSFSAWKKHEEKNWRQELYVCPIAVCPKNDGMRNIFLRKEQYDQHVQNHHLDADSASACAENAKLRDFGRYDRNCIFKGCSATFDTWKTRLDHLHEKFMTLQWVRNDWRAAEGCGGRCRRPGDRRGGDEDRSDSDDQDHDKKGPSHRKRRRPNPSAPTKEQKAQMPEGNSLRSTSQNSRGHAVLSNPFLNVRKKMEQIQSTSIGHVHDTTHRVERWLPNITPMKFSKPQSDVVRILKLTATAVIQQVRSGSGSTNFVRKIVHSLPPSKQDIHQEAVIMSRLDHPHIVKYISSTFEESTLTITMTPFAEFDLRDYMRDRTKQLDSTEHEWQWFSCLATGLDYMHQCGVRHRDIKPSNILVRQKTVLFTDFGLSNLISDDHSLDSNIGFFTRQYAAPEFWTCPRDCNDGCCCGCYRGRASDVWSLGLVFLELLTYLMTIDINTAYCPASLRNGEPSKDRSYANNPDAVNRWTSYLGKASESTEQEHQRQSELLSMSERMIHRDFTKRPKAREIRNLVGDCSHTSNDVQRPQDLLPHGKQSPDKFDSFGEAENPEKIDKPISKENVGATKLVSLPSKLAYLRLVDYKLRRIVPAPFPCEYAALSYVWGTDDTSETPRTTNQMLPTVLPRAAELGIQNSRKRGVRYLWIDKLCNAGDIKSNIYQMHLVYQQAKMFLVALGEDSLRYDRASQCLNNAAGSLRLEVNFTRDRGIARAQEHYTDGAHGEVEKCWRVVIDIVKVKESGQTGGRTTDDFHPGSSESGSDVSMGQFEPARSEADANETRQHVQQSGNLRRLSNWDKGEKQPAESMDDTAQPASNGTDLSSQEGLKRLQLNREPPVAFHNPFTSREERPTYNDELKKGRSPHQRQDSKDSTSSSEAYNLRLEQSEFVPPGLTRASTLSTMSSGSSRSSSPLVSYRIPQVRMDGMSRAEKTGNRWGIQRSYTKDNTPTRYSKEFNLDRGDSRGTALR